MVKITSKTKKIIEQNPVTIATVDEKKMPNISVVAYVKVVAPDAVIITDNFMTQTRRNVLKNQNVCLAVWNKKWEGVKMVGNAQYHRGGVWRQYVRSMKENNGLPAKGAIVVTISKLINLK